MRIKLSPKRQHYSAVKYIESDDEFIFILQDSEETSRLTKQLFLGHIGAMVAFITICLALPAWVFAAANIFMSPKAAFVHIRCSKENLIFSRHYIRFGIDKLLAPHPVSIGPQVLGRGEAEPPITISYSEIESLDWNGIAFELRLQNRDNIIVQVNNAISSEMEIVLEKARTYIQQRKEMEQNSLSFEKNEGSALKHEDLPIDNPITIEKEVPPSKEEEIRPSEEIKIDETIEEEIEEPNLEIHQEVLSPFDTVIAEIKQRSSQLLADDNYDQYKGKIYSLNMKLERIAPTFDFQLEEKYKGGRSLIGKLDGINIVAYQQKEIETSEDSIGEEVQLQVSFYDWKSILQQVIVKIV